MATDDFTGASQDLPDHNGNWKNAVGGTSPIDVDCETDGSGKAVANLISSRGGNYWSDGGQDGDSWSYVHLNGLVNASGFIGVTARMGAENEGILARTRDGEDSSIDDVIIRMDDAYDQVLSFINTYDLTTGDCYLGIRINGSDEPEVYVEDASNSETATGNAIGSIITGGFPGIVSAPNNEAGSGEFAGWGDDLSALKGGGAATPKGPLGLPFYGPFGGPIG